MRSSRYLPTFAAGATRRHVTAVWFIVIIGCVQANSDAQVGSGTKADSVNWTSWGPDVIARAKKEEKLILIDVYADWCGPCKMMDRTTYRDPKVIAKLKGFIAVKVNSDTDREAASRFGTGSIPTTVILTSDGNPILTQSGYLPPKQFLGLFEKAERSIAELERQKKAAVAEPDDPDKALALGERYFEMQRPADAALWLERALARGASLGNKARADAAFKLGLAYLMSNSFEQGIARLKSFRKGYPDHPKRGRAAELIEIGTYYSAQAKVKAGDFAGAREAYGRVVKLGKNPKIVEAARKELRGLKLVGQVAPEIRVSEWVRGEATTLKKLKGKVVLLDFFQIICPGCRRVHPHILKMQSKYAGQGFQVLGIAVAFEYKRSQTAPLIRTFVVQEEFNYPVAIDRGFTSTFNAYGAGGTPYVALIDRSGRVRHLDFYDAAAVESLVVKLLAEKAGKQ